VNKHSNPQNPDAHLDTGTRLALQRTFLAHERTQMAWVRTSLTLITFGFSIAKYFESQRDNEGVRALVLHPRTVGILMISIGLVSLALGGVQHMLAVRALRQEWPGLPRSLAGVTAILLALLGVVALFASLLRH
jgi:putative membrane protein